MNSLHLTPEKALNEDKVINPGYGGPYTIVGIIGDIDLYGALRSVTRRNTCDTGTDANVRAGMTPPISSTTAKIPNIIDVRPSLNSDDTYNPAPMALESNWTQNKSEYELVAGFLRSLPYVEDCAGSSWLIADSFEGTRFNNGIMSAFSAVSFTVMILWFHPHSLYTISGGQAIMELGASL